MADMAGLDESEQGVVATVLLASYVVTPLMAFSVSGIITVIVSLSGFGLNSPACRNSYMLTLLLPLLLPLLLQNKLYP